VGELDLVALEATLAQPVLQRLRETRTCTTSTSIGGQSKRSAAAVMKVGSDR